MYRSATMHSVTDMTDGQTDRQAVDNIMPIMDLRTMFAVYHSQDGNHKC